MDIGTQTYASLLVNHAYELIRFARSNLTGEGSIEALAVENEAEQLAMRAKGVRIIGGNVVAPQSSLALVADELGLRRQQPDQPS